MKYQKYNSSSRLYAIWKGIKRRCNNLNYHHFENYGGRGISVCDEWNSSFELFAEWADKNGYNEKVDTDKGYCPENCKWADRIEQNNNTRRNHFIEYQGCTYTIAELSKIFGINQNTLLYRIRRGWKINDALETKVNVHG